MPKRPGWFIILACALILWGLAGCASFYVHVFHGAEMAAKQGPWDEAFFAALPGWLTAVYAVAVGGGLLGSIALLAGSRLAQPLYWASLIAVVAQFGYIFLATDIIAHKGLLVAAGFPVFILVMAALQIWIAGLARRRGWIG